MGVELSSGVGPDVDTAIDGEVLLLLLLLELLVSLDDVHPIALLFGEALSTLHLRIVEVPVPTAA